MQYTIDVFFVSHHVHFFISLPKHIPFCVDILTSLQMSEFNKCILEMRSILYGIDGAEPVLEACAQLTQEFMKEDTIRLLIVCLPKLDLGVRIMNTVVTHYHYSFLFIVVTISIFNSSILNFRIIP